MIGTTIIVLLGEEGSQIQTYKITLIDTETNIIFAENTVVGRIGSICCFGREVNPSRINTFDLTKAWNIHVLFNLPNKDKS